MAGMSQGERARRHKHREIVSRWKRLKGCATCGFRGRYGYQLELDHVCRTSKEKRVGTDRAFEAHWSLSRIKQEMAKCQVLCKNCHALKNIQGKSWDKLKNAGHARHTKTHLPSA